MSQKLSVIHVQLNDEREAEISNPRHYVEGRTIEPISLIEDWNLNHHLACALKYISRAGRKHDEIKDLKKAIWYLERRIKVIEEKKSLKD